MTASAYHAVESTSVSGQVRPDTSGSSASSYITCATMARVVVTSGANLLSPMPDIRPDACAKSTAGLYQPLAASSNVFSTIFRPETAARSSAHSATRSASVSAAASLASTAA